MKSVRPVEFVQVMLLLRRPSESTAHTVNVYRDPGVKPLTVITGCVVDSLSEWPTRL